MKKILTDAEIETIKNARKILKRLTKKAIAWDNKINDDISDEDESDKEQTKFGDWLYELYSKAKIDFLSNEAFIDLN